MACGNVEEAKLVGARLVVGEGAFDRIAGIAQVDEIDALDHAAVFHVEAGNNARLEGHYSRLVTTGSGALVLRSRNTASASPGSSRPS